MSEATMVRRDAQRDTVGRLDEATSVLVELAATIAVGTEPVLRDAMAGAAARGSPLDPVWVEELILQSYLFVGFPRTLNALRAWRAASGRAAPATDEGANLANAADWARRGERTCAVVYGEMYERLRANVRQLHPALDAWMVVEGYGKVLSRPGLDLKRRELCIVAVCAVTGQERQLHSHLHGALNAGASPQEVSGALGVTRRLVDPERMRRVEHLWGRVSRR